MREIDRDNYRFTARNLGVVINDLDSLSIQIGDYYQRRRNIPPENMIHVRFAPGKTTLSVAEFKTLKRQIDRRASAQVEGFALTWIAPYRVDCMSITSAMALGYDPQYCASGCASTGLNPYFNRESNRPYSDFKVRPTILLAARNFQQAKQLIDRGIAADHSQPTGTAYLMNTSDVARNVRSPNFPLTKEALAPRFKIEIIAGDELRDRRDVMFYFTGLAQVNGLETLDFLPGAIADHLTSFGGQLTEKNGQMSSLNWLEAGATGSYGTVVEPCNFPEKFPNVGIVIENYLDGATLLESYWRSVLWVGQGVFIGEPLARPFGQP